MFLVQGVGRLPVHSRACLAVAGQMRMKGTYPTKEVGGVPQLSLDEYRSMFARTVASPKDTVQAPRLAMPKEDYVHYVDIVNDMFIRLRKPEDPGYAWETVGQRKVRDDRLTYHWLDFDEGVTRVALRPPPKAPRTAGFLEIHWHIWTAVLFLQSQDMHRPPNYVSWEIPSRWLTQLKMQQWPDSCPVLFPIDRAEVDEHLDLLIKERDNLERSRRKLAVYSILETPPWVDQSKIAKE